MHDTGNALRLWLIGQGVVMLSMGLMMWAAYAWLGLPSAAALALIAALADFVPFIGPILGALPALVIASTIDMQTLLWTLGAVVVAQQIESYALMPFVQRRAVKLPPFIGLFSIVVFGTLFGLIVRDTQIRVLLGDTPPTPVEMTRTAIAAVDDFLTLFGAP